MWAAFDRRIGAAQIDLSSPLMGRLIFACWVIRGSVDHLQKFQNLAGAPQGPLGLATEAQEAPQGPLGLRSNQDS